ncbi:MAG: thioredoxin [Planctomycetaceae bacterium]|nr:thioredoxin [Planctomycetaceae bacterium]
MPAPTSPPARSSMRYVVLGLFIVAVVQCILMYLTRPEPAPPPIDGIEVTLTDANFQQEVLDHSGYVLVDFWFAACPPCQKMKPVVAHLSVNYRDKVKVGKVDIDDYGELAERYELSAFPTLLLFKDGEVVAQWEGYAGLKQTSAWLDSKVVTAAAARDEA